MAKSVDGVDVTPASSEQLDTYNQAESEINSFGSSVQPLYDENDPDSRVFFALFDGTGNDLDKDPAHATNVGLLYKELRDLERNNKNISANYKEGPGTQGMLKDGTLDTAKAIYDKSNSFSEFKKNASEEWDGLKDGATGGTYTERINVMYEKFNHQAAAWLKENPNAKIIVISVGFSRGAEQAAGFSRVVAERGISDPDDDAAPALRAGQDIPQSVGLYDPVGTGEPKKHNRQLPSTVVSGIQITAADEFRTTFPSSVIINQGVSDDGRFLGVTTSGCHSDIGGSYKLNGLSNRNYNLMGQYLNSVLGMPLIKKIDVIPDPEKDVIHDSSQGKWFYVKGAKREFITNIEGETPSKVDLFISVANTLRGLAMKAMSGLADLSVDAFDQARQFVEEKFSDEPTSACTECDALKKKDS